MDSETKLSLNNLGRGAAIERFDDELRRVLENILDPNTDTKARTITLKVTIKPDDNREACAVAIGCAAKLGSSKPVGTTIYVGKNRDGVTAMEFDPKQGGLFDPEQEAKSKLSTIHPISKAQ